MRNFSNFRFIIHELFLYSIAVGLKNENYKFVEELLYSSCFFNDKYKDQVKPQRFEKLYNYVDLLDQYYKQTYSSNFISPMADFIIKRVPENMNQNHIIDADLICYYISVLENIRWFPITYVYRTRERFELFDRLISLRHFEKIKVLFNVKNPKELKDKLISIKEKNANHNRIGYPNSFDSVLPIYRIIDIEKIAMTR